MAKLTIDIGAKIDGMKRGLSQASSRLKTWANKMQGVTKVAFAGIGVGIIAMVKESAQLAAQFEQIKVAFTTMTGSAARAKELISELNEFSKATPFSPEQVTKAAKTLLAFGFAAKDVSGTLKLLGDVSAGTGKDLGEMAVIFGQIKGAGRLMGGDLLQLINAGFNPLQVMSEKTGKSMATLKDEMSKGAISFAMVEQAFKDVTSEGGIFFDMMEKQSNTLNGQLSTLKGAVGDVMRKFGEGLLPELKSTTSWMLELAKAMGEVAEARSKLDVGGAVSGESISLPGATLEEAREIARRGGLSSEGELGGLFGGSIVSKSLAGQVTIGMALKPPTTEEVEEKKKEIADRIEKGKHFLDPPEISDLADAEFASADPVGDFFKSQRTKFDKIQEDAERERFADAKEAAKKSAGQGIKNLEEQGHALQKTIGAAFQPGGKIQSRLARIGGERTINVDRQIPQKQLDQLMQVNKGIEALKKSIESIDGLSFPGAR